VKFGWDSTNPDLKKEETIGQKILSYQDKLKRNFTDRDGAYNTHKRMSSHTNVIFAAASGR
jgi:hypothetical protein